MNLAIAENRLRRAWKSEIANQSFRPDDLSAFQLKIMDAMSDGRERNATDISVKLSSRGVNVKLSEIKCACSLLVKKGYFEAGGYSNDGPKITIYRRAV
jgi:hypothetical protein